jgi:hypothetical protein
MCALVFFHTHVQGYFCVFPVCLFSFNTKESQDVTLSSLNVLKPDDVLVNFCATQQFPYIFEVAAQFCEFVRNFTR